jgi:tetratricopeptide (TPR) repeat protein
LKFACLLLGLLFAGGGILVFGAWYFWGSLSAQTDSPIVAKSITKDIEINESDPASEPEKDGKTADRPESDMLKSNGELTSSEESAGIGTIKKTDSTAKGVSGRISPPPTSKPEKMPRRVKNESSQEAPKKEVEPAADMPEPIKEIAYLEEPVKVDTIRKSEVKTKDRLEKKPATPSSKTAKKQTSVKKDTPRKAPRVKDKSLQSNQIALFLQKALRYHRQGKFDQAILMYQQVLRVEPEHRDALFNLASAYIQLADYADAYPLLKKLRSFGAGDPDILVNLAIVEIGMGKSAEAIPLLDLASKRYEGPKFEVYFHRAVALSRLNRLEEALISYKKAQEINPKHPTLNFNLAVLSDKLHKYHEAVDYYRAFIRHGGNLPKYEEQKIESRIRSLRMYLAGSGS